MDNNENTQQAIAVITESATITIAVQCPHCNATDIRRLDARVLEVTAAECPQCGKGYSFPNPLLTANRTLISRQRERIEELRQGLERFANPDSDIYVLCRTIIDGEERVSYRADIDARMLIRVIAREILAKDNGE